MGKSKAKILILEDDACFREVLEKVCGQAGEVDAAGDFDSALVSLTKKSYDLLLLDWHLYRRQWESLSSTLENFQPNALRIALFTVPDLQNVITAMKSGICDIFWPAQDSAVLLENVQTCLLGPPPDDF